MDLDFIAPVEGRFFMLVGIVFLFFFDGMSGLFYGALFDRRFLFVICMHMGISYGCTCVYFICMHSRMHMCISYGCTRVSGALYKYIFMCIM